MTDTSTVTVKISKKDGSVSVGEGKNKTTQKFQYSVIEFDQESGYPTVADLSEALGVSIDAEINEDGEKEGRSIAEFAVFGANKIFYTEALNDAKNTPERNIERMSSITESLKKQKLTDEQKAELRKMLEAL